MPRRPRYRIQRLTAAQQYAALAARCSGTGTVHKNTLRWDYTARPTPLSREYELFLKLTDTGSPKVWVKEPDVKALASGRPLPHVYSEDPAQLCLYLPRTREWTPSTLLAVSIVPWSVLWLFYFEAWLATGDWKGGGVHLPREA